MNKPPIITAAAIDTTGSMLRTVDLICDADTLHTIGDPWEVFLLQLQCSL